MSIVTASEPVVDSAEFRRCVGSFATGVTVVTAFDGDARAGMTLNSFSSVSLDPLLVLVSLARDTRTLELVRDTKRFAVSVLGAHQQDVALAFARPGAVFPDGLAEVDESGHLVVPGRSPSCAAPSAIR